MACARDCPQIEMDLDPWTCSESKAGLGWAETRSRVVNMLHRRAPAGSGEMQWLPPSRPPPPRPLLASAFTLLVPVLCLVTFLPAFSACCVP